jgi:hypothetical protein
MAFVALVAGWAGSGAAQNESGMPRRGGGWPEALDAQGRPAAVRYPTNEPVPVYEIHGRVIDDRDGQPVQGAILTLRWAGWRSEPVGFSGGPLDRATTREDGGFTITSVKPPDTPFTVHVGGAGPRGSITRIASAYAATPTDPLEIHLPKEVGWIAGRVVSPEGESVNAGTVGAYVAKSEYGTNHMLASGSPDRDGIFVIGPVAPGVYNVIYEVQRGGRKKAPRSDFIVQTRPGVRTAPADRVQETSLRFEVTINPQIALKVVDENGAPVQGCQIITSAFTDGEVRQLRETGTRSDGTCRIGSEGNGHYLFSVIDPRFRGFGLLDTRIEAGADGRIPPQTIIFRTGDSCIRGSVRYADGSPVHRRVSIRVNPVLTDGLTADPLVWGVSPNGEGFFSSRPLPAGTYLLEIKAATKSETGYQMEIDHRAGQDTVVTIVR